MPGEAPFRVIRPLGRGGMASVFEVQLPGDPRRLAAKVLAATSPTARERFRREGETLALLRHPNIVTVHGSGETPDGRPYLLLELVDGRSLGERLEAGGALPVAEALRIASAVASGLAAAHAQGIVHRDVKPANVLLDGDGGVRLTDFGIALALDQERLTRSGHWAGTIYYMAPEQLSTSAELGPAVDVYAVGVLLFEALTGKVPFEADDLNQLRVLIVEREAPSVRALRPDVPPAVAALVARCLEKSPALRHAKAAELQRDLDALAAGRRPVTSASGVKLGLRRVLRRRLAKVALALGVAVGLALGAVALVGGVERERELRGATAEVDGLARELDRRLRSGWKDALDGALARGEAAHAAAIDDGDLEGAARVGASLEALARARDRALAREATRALQRGDATPAPAALADAVAAWSRVSGDDDAELAEARAWTLLAAGRSAPIGPVAGARGPWLRAWSGARAGDARAALAAATQPELRAEIALALGALDDVRPSSSPSPDAALLRARLELARAAGAPAPTCAALLALRDLARADAPAPARALASLALGEAALALGWDASAADACAVARALLGPDPPIVAVRWPVLGERVLLHPATAALLGEAQARAWLHDGEAALLAARAAADRAALDDPRALLAARLLEADALDLLEGYVEAQAALALVARLPGAAPHVAAVAARAAARRGQPTTLAPDDRALDALARGWGELEAACSGPHSHRHGSDAKHAALRRARRSFRLGLGGGVTDPTAWAGLGIVHRALDEVALADQCEERAAQRGAGQTWERLALASMLDVVAPGQGESYPLRALTAAATQAARPVDRALDLVSAVRWVDVFGAAAAGVPDAGELLDRVSQLAATLPFPHDLAVIVDERLLALPRVDPELHARARARVAARRATLEQVAELRKRVLAESNAELRAGGTPEQLAELLRLDPGSGASYRNYYNVHGQFAPGGFDSQAIALELDPLATFNDLSTEAERLAREGAGGLSETLHGRALLDTEERVPVGVVEPDDDVRRALAFVYALELGRPVDLPTRLAGLEAAHRYARRRPQALGAWLLLGRARLECGDPCGALEPLMFATRVPDPFGDRPSEWRLVPLVHTAQAWAALGEWGPACNTLELAARLGWRSTDQVRRQRWFKLDDGRGQLAPQIEQLLTKIDAGSR